MIIETKTPQETFEVGKKIGENAKPGQIYTLTGDLGVGKTVDLEKGFDYRRITVIGPENS